MTYKYSQAIWGFDNEVCDLLIKEIVTLVEWNKQPHCYKPATFLAGNTVERLAVAMAELIDAGFSDETIRNWAYTMPDAKKAYLIGVLVRGTMINLGYIGYADELTEEDKARIGTPQIMMPG